MNDTTKTPTVIAKTSAEMLEDYMETAEQDIAADNFTNGTQEFIGIDFKYDDEDELPANVEALLSFGGPNIWVELDMLYEGWLTLHGAWAWTQAETRDIYNEALYEELMQYLELEIDRAI